MSQPQSDVAGEFPSLPKVAEESKPDSEMQIDEEGRPKFAPAKEHVCPDAAILSVRDGC